MSGRLRSTRRRLCTTLPLEMFITSCLRKALSLTARSR
jgi:hypothetical protein